MIYICLMFRGKESPKIIVIKTILKSSFLEINTVQQDMNATR